MRQIRSARTSLQGLFRKPTGDEAGSTTYFYFVDLLRGVAALSILLWHYNHFYWHGSYKPEVYITREPLFHYLKPAYVMGGSAVQLFWVISGFVFSATYGHKRVSARMFFIHRFSRLYPLHITTLLLVCMLQVLAIHVRGHNFIYDGNNLINFIIQLFMASAWLPSVIFSYNGPIWTVSAEVVIYACFYAALNRVFNLGVAIPLTVAAISYCAMHTQIYLQISSCSFYFFVGVTLYCLNSALRDEANLCLAIAFFGMAVGGVLIVFGRLGDAALLIVSSAVFLAATIDRKRWIQGYSRWMKTIGDNTYGTYLWHTPVQILLLLIIPESKIDSVADRPIFLVVYLTIVVLVARCFFLVLERPARRIINQRWSALSAF